ncbi:site-specific integrase [Pseudomonas sp. CK-NBRI-02]|uniref:tyrosine-type recombinase/integrase n=1 Tax=Pseudomonas sp. CK-NBRI-02 TaxID=2249759 RepID=UPI0003AAF33F|nr:site-specific integrase [Pseudomonas sp. CK-NBRI-02]TYO83677.1 site-specific integrase [Pseudomonas sp. CK-NBRI-02]
MSVSKTLTVTISDAEIRRHAAGEVRQLRDTRHRELRFRYSSKDRTRGAWHVVVRQRWGKAGDFPGINTKTMLATLPAILARRAADADAKSTTTSWTTVGDVLEWYRDRMNRDRGLSAKRKASARSALDRHLMPRLHDLALGEISKQAIDQRLMWPMQERYALSFVRSVYGVLSAAFRQALRLDLLPANPMAALKFTDFVRTRIRPKPARLRGDDVPGLLMTVAERFGAAPAGCMLALMMLCHGSRLGETRLARWRNVNLDAGRWFIPAGDTKTKAEHTLPLTAQACALLRRYRRLQAAQGYTGPLLFPGSHGAPLSPSKANTLFTDLARGEWSSHDLRKVARTAWTDLGVDYMVGELLLNHAMKDLDATYIHTTAEALKRRALEAWHQHLDSQGFTAIHTGTLPGHETACATVEASNGAGCSTSQHPSQGRMHDQESKPGDGHE